MKSLLITILILLNIFIFSGCSSSISSLPKGQQKAVKNSIKFIKNSSFTFKDRINTDAVKVENMDEIQRTGVSSKVDGSKVDESKIDLTDWIITIGDVTSGHDFAFIVCDSKTYEVIGYIPIE